MELRSLFIVGPPRSGTTLMAYLLAGGDGVLCLSEPHLHYAISPHWRLNRFYREFQRSAGLMRLRPPRQGNKERYAAFLRKMARMNGFRCLAIKETFRDEGGPRYRNVELIDELASCADPPVTLIRHPYDMAASSIRLHKWLVGLRGRLLRWRWPAMRHYRNYTEIVRTAAHNWVCYCGWVRRRDFQLLRYEDLVSAPQRHLPEICKRCAIPYDPRLLDHRRPRAAFAGIGDYQLLNRPPRPISTRSVGKADNLTAEQRDIVRAACGELAAQFGYAL